MRNSVYIVLLFLGLGNSLFAQQACSCSAATDMETLLEDRVLAQAYSLKIKSPEIQFSTEWKRGDIYLFNGEVVHNKFLRYNGFSDQLFWLREKDYQLSVIEHSLVAGFSLNDTVLHTKAIYRKIKTNNWMSRDSLEAFLQVLAEGELGLFVQRSVKCFSNTNEYFTKYQYYALVNGEMKAISLRRRALVKLLGEKKALMRSIIRQYDLDLSTESGMTQAVVEFNKSNAASKNAASK